VTITALEYEDTQRPWKLTRTELGPCHLFIGASGAGKTAALQALAEVCLMGLDRPGARHPGGTRRWRVEVQPASGPAYAWEAAVEVQTGSLSARREPRHLDHPWPVRFVYERITAGAGGEARDIVSRSPDELLYHGEPLAVVKPTESAIAMLGHAPGADDLAPLSASLERVMVSSGDPAATLSMAFVQVLGALDHTPASPEELREADPVPLLVKAYLARVHVPARFERLRGRYVARVPHVEDVTVGVSGDLVAGGFAGVPEDAFVLALKEQGVGGWIPAPQISSGMLRAFFHLAELELAPRGTTIVIDGFAGDLGGRCVPALAELMWQRRDELQLVLASQHPHVARSLPLACWHVVTRRAGVVTVWPAAAIPELATLPREDAFERLVHAPA
jgi:hypothetical protein